MPCLSNRRKFGVAGLQSGVCGWQAVKLRKPQVLEKWGSFDPRGVSRHRFLFSKGPYLEKGLVSNFVCIIILFFVAKETGV